MSQNKLEKKKNPNTTQSTSTYNADAVRNHLSLLRLRNLLSETSGSADKALIASVIHGSLEEVNILLDNHANPTVSVAGYFPDITKEKFPVIFLAAQKGYEPIVSRLLESGARENEKMRGETPRALVTRRRQARIEELHKALLINSDVNQILDKENHTPLILAIKLGAYDLAKSLIEDGANFLLEDIYENNALDVCPQEQQEALLLTSQKRHQEQQESAYLQKLSGNEPANSEKTDLWNEQGTGLKSYQNIKTSLALPCNLEKRNSKADTPLLASVRVKGNHRIALLLIKAGANFKAQDKQGKTAIDIIQHTMEVSSPAYTSIMVAIEEITCKKETNKSLAVAVIEGYYNLAQYAISQGEDVNQLIGKNRETPLIYTIKNKYFNIARLLIDNKADIHRKNKQGETAAEIAKKMTLSETESKAIEILLGTGNIPQPPKGSRAMRFFNNDFQGLLPTSFTTSASLIDLHGCSVKGAQAATTSTINKATDTNITNLRMVTGRGNHINKKGQRGVLYKEFPNWISEDQKEGISSITAQNGFYEVALNPASSQRTIETMAKEYVTQNIDMIRELAEQGDSDSQCTLGECYQYGRGVEKNEKQAVQWYVKACTQENPYAQHALGGCYWQGIGVKQNDQTAIQLFEAAAAQQFPQALFQLGDMYSRGQAVKIDHQKAFEYYQKASSLGMDLATRRIADAYLQGRGVKKDTTKGFLLHKKIADTGDSYSTYNVAFSYYHGIGTPKNRTQAIYYANRSAEQGDGDSWYLLSDIASEDPSSTEEYWYYIEQAALHKHKHALFQMTLHPKSLANPELEIHYEVRAAKQGNIVAQAMVLNRPDIPQEALSSQERASIRQEFWQQPNEDFFAISSKHYRLIVVDAYLLTESKTKKQQQKVTTLLQTLATQGYTEAYFRLGALSLTGRVVTPAVIQEAKCYWETGAKLGDRYCYHRLGNNYETGLTDEMNHTKALFYHQEAAKRHHAGSYLALGKLYHKSPTIKKDLDKAFFYYEKAMYIDKYEHFTQEAEGLLYRSIFPEAAFCMGLLYQERAYYCKNETERNNLAMESADWLITAENAGSTDATTILNKLGVGAEDGRFSSKDKVEETSTTYSL